jgi:hypothetical protein
VARVTYSQDLLRRYPSHTWCYLNYPSSLRLANSNIQDTPWLLQAGSLHVTSSIFSSLCSLRERSTFLSDKNAYQSREVPEHGIDVHKQMKQAPVEISRPSVALSQPPQRKWLLLSNRRHVGVRVPVASAYSSPELRSAHVISSPFRLAYHLPCA